MKRFLVILILIVISIIVGLWSPWLQWNIRPEVIFGVREPDKIASLQVFSLSGEIEVLVDGELQQGTARLQDGSPVIVDRVNPGDRLITLRRKTPLINTYWNLEKVIHFEANTSVVIAYNLGPSELFSEGHIIYADSLTTEGNVKVQVNADNAIVRMNNIPLTVNGNVARSTISFDRQYVLQVERQGFEPVSFTVLPESQEERDKLSSFSINVDVNLMYQPVPVE
jgi:hypothetical protein